MSKKNKTNKNHLSDLLSFMGAEKEEPLYDVDQLLTEAGFNPGEVGKKFQMVANQSMAESPHNWRKSANVAYIQAREDYSKTKPMEKRHRSRAEILEAINSLVSQQNLKVSFAHRNLSDQTDDDLESLLNQLEYIATHKSTDTDE
jgi:hypothetical protein